MFDLVARLVNRWAWPMALGTLAIAVLAGLFGAPVAGALTGGNQDFVTPGSESFRGIDRIERATGTVADGGVIALVTLPGSVEAAASRAKVEQVAAVMAADPTFVQLLTYYQTQDRSMVADDERSTYVLGRLRPGADDDFADAIVRLGDNFDGDPTVALGGTQVVDDQVVATVQHDLARAELLAFPVLFLLSLWIFRSLVAAALPVVVGGLNVLLTLFGLRVVNSFTELSVFSLNLVTALGLGLAIDYSLLVVSRFRSQLAAGDDTAQAIITTLHTAGRTILFSSLTVGAAMASLFVFQQRFLISMAVGGVLVAVSAALVSLLALPAVLRLLGRRIDLLAPPRFRRELEQPEAASGWFTLARMVMRRAVVFAVASVALLVALGLPFIGVTFTAASAKDLPPSASGRAVDDTLRADYPVNPRETIQVVVAAPADRSGPVADLAARIGGLPDAASATPPQWLGDDTWLIQVSPAEPGMSESTQDLVARVRELPSADPVLVGGETAGFMDLKSSLAANLPIAALIVGLTTFALLALMTGSVVLPVQAVLMNLLTISATVGVLVVIFQDGQLGWLFGHSAQGALDATQPILLFALVFGLSTDYGVFLFARIKEARDAGAGNKQSIVLGVGRTGRIVTAAALLFCVALGALATSQIVFIKELGVGTAIGVMIDATIVRAFLVPSIMALLGRWSWWGPAPLRWLHERFGLRERPSSRAGQPGPTHGTENPVLIESDIVR